MWGNGAATARVFAQQGCKVFGCDLNLSSAEYTQKKIQAEGGEMTVVQTDVTKNAEVKALVEAVMKKYGRIDVLVKYVCSPPDVDSLTYVATWACRNLEDRQTCLKKFGTHKWMSI